jgi:predicted AAA+ superfamily ATPase
MKDFLKEILVQNQERRPLKELKHSNTDLSLGMDKIQVIIRPRRVKKTSAMLLAIDELITKRDILKEYIIYFNFEDERV